LRKHTSMAALLLVPQTANHGFVTEFQKLYSSHALRLPSFFPSHSHKGMKKTAAPKKHVANKPVQ